MAPRQGGLDSRRTPPGEALVATVYVSLGSNVGDRADFVTRAIVKLSKHPQMEVRSHSELYETEPLEMPDQEWFVNAVVRIETPLAPMSLLDALQGLEAEMQREQTVTWGPRAIDLDILLYDDLLVAEPRLMIPHIRMHDRAFVLVPLAEIAPDATHPILGLSVQDMLAGLKTATVVRPLAHS